MKKFKAKGLTGYKVTVIFAWYDFWVGIFYDRAKSRVYIFPVPMVGLLIEKKFPEWWK